MTWKKSAITLFILAVFMTACGNNAPQEMAISEAASAPMAEMAVEMEESAAGLAFRDDTEFGGDVELSQSQSGAQGSSFATRT